jgi:RimJ/RimL family protein N-acetyltransferase
MNQVVFETKRLRVRVANEHDVDLVYSLWTHPDVMKFVGFPNGLRITREEVMARIEACEHAPFECLLIVEERETAVSTSLSTSVSIGQCLMHNPNDAGIAITDVKLLPEFWGNKYGVEVKQGLVDYLFTHTDCVAVEGSPNINNIASIKMQEAVGGVRIRENVYEFPESMRDFTTTVYSIIYYVKREVWRMRKNGEKEVVELHQFFQDWFNGSISNTDEQFARFADVMADSFGMVPPNGRFVTRTPLLAGLRGSYGRSQQSPGRIWIENFVTRQTGPDWLLATYEEWQTFDNNTTSRLSTVLLQEHETAPNGFIWLHVHETWLNS